MTSTSWMILCLAYILGLLFSKLAWGGFLLLGLSVAPAFLIRRWWRAAPKPRIWLAAGMVALLASFYFQLRDPRPQATDISHLLATPEMAKQEWVVAGRVESLPQVTRSQKARFWLQVQQVSSSSGEAQTIANKSATGKLYVTVPLLQATGLHPGQTISVKGSLYPPKPAANPGAFDFREYLQQEGSFTGIRGRQVTVPEQPTGWGWWQVQQRIVRSQMLWLGSPAGPLVSAMVLGSRGVDLPYDVKDTFVRVGLAHALAASGFQTSLILGVVLALMRRFSAKAQFAVGTSALAIFVGLTGLQPAVLRAAIMGFGGLAALLLQRKIIPLGSMLVAATLLLLANPLWIWDLGFQLSFLATLGLLVTVPPLTRWFDWVPSAIAPLIAVPIAAYLWTLPLQLYAFGVLSPYSIPVNLITTPLISLLSLGGMVSALAALVWSPAGSTVAWLLKYPAQALIAVVDWFSQLPGNAYAVGTISVFIAIALYGLLCLTWLQPWWRKQSWVALVLAVGLVAIPVWQTKASQFQVTLLAAKQPVMVIQDAGKAALVNSGDGSTVDFSLLPFLQKQGVNEIRWAIAPDPEATGWTRILQRLSVKNLYALPQGNASSAATLQSATRQPQPPISLIPGYVVKLGSTQVKLISEHPMAVEFQMHSKRWLWLASSSLEQQMELLKTGELSPTQVLLWSGKHLHSKLIEVLQPEAAIAAANTIHPETAEQLRKIGTQLYWTGRDGALQWTPTEGFKTTLDPTENTRFAL